MTKAVLEAKSEDEASEQPPLFLPLLLPSPQVCTPR